MLGPLGIAKVWALRDVYKSMGSLGKGNRPAMFSLLFLFISVSSYRSEVCVRFHFMPFWQMDLTWTLMGTTGCQCVFTASRLVSKRLYDSSLSYRNIDTLSPNKCICEWEFKALQPWASYISSLNLFSYQWDAMTSAQLQHAIWKWTPVSPKYPGLPNPASWTFSTFSSQARKSLHVTLWFSGCS